MAEKRETESIIDLDEALVVTAGDREMLTEMAKLFLVEGPKQLQAVGDRVQAGDAEGIRKTVHTLKGSVVIFGAGRCGAAALAVERAAAENQLSKIDASWELLNEEMIHLLREVENLTRG